MTWKFPGTGAAGAAIDSTLEDLGLWDEREKIAKRLYDEATTKDVVWAWDKLNESERKPWLKKAQEQMR